MSSNSQPVILGTKPAAKSKTIIFNCAVAALSVLTEQTGLLDKLLSDRGILILLMAISAVNVYLRSITDTAIKFKD
jgi:hypothetical protein